MNTREDKALGDSESNISGYSATAVLGPCAIHRFRESGGRGNKYLHRLSVHYLYSRVKLSRDVGLLMTASFTTPKWNNASLNVMLNSIATNKYNCTVLFIYSNKKFLVSLKKVRV